MKIVAEELTRKFKVGMSEITAVDTVNLKIEEPSFVSVVGRSGSGKSTLLNLIGLNDSPTAGRILIDGENTSLFSTSMRKKIRLFRMGFIFQTFNLFPTLDALENVQLPMTLARRPLHVQKERATRLLESVGLATRLLHRPKELSIGEMQRVAVARAMANNPEILIADEPTGELDSATAKEVIDLLHTISRKEQKTVVVATHDERVVDVSDAVYLMQDGKIQPKKLEDHREQS